MKRLFDVLVVVSVGVLLLVPFGVVALTQGHEVRAAGARRAPACRAAR